jgi:hypothetical protein
MTPELKKACHRLLVRAKTKLSYCRPDGKFAYLCWTLDSRRIKNGAEAETYLLTLISQRLGRFTFYTEWLANKHPELSVAIREDKDRNYSKQAQRSRHAWLDSLIKEFA